MNAFFHGASQRRLALAALWLSMTAACGSESSGPGSTGGVPSTGGLGSGGTSQGGAAQGGAVPSTGGLPTSTGGQLAGAGSGGTVTSGGSSGGGSPTGGAPFGGAGASPGGSSAGGGATGSGGALTGGGGATSGNGGTTTGGGANAGGGSTSTGGAQSGGAGGTSQGGNSGGGQGGSGGKGGAGGAPQAGAGGGAGTGGAATGYSPCPPAGQACKIMPFGDSITDGYNVAGGYRMDLFRSARAANKTLTFVGSQQNGPTQVDGITFPRNHEGHSGYTIDNEPQVNRSGISPLVAGSMSNYKPHIVTLMIGTNDADVNIDMATANQRLGALMDSILNADANVLLVLAQIVPSRRDDLNTRVRAYNATMPALVTARVNAGKHVLLVDMYGAFTRDTNYKTTLLADDLHPSTAGYLRMAETWYQALGSVLH